MRYPSAVWIPSPNYWPGHDERLAVCLHIMQGEYAGSIKYMQGHGTSSHFAVSKRGAVAQLVDTDDSAWGNGLSYNPQQQAWICPHDAVVTPRWPVLQTDRRNPNRLTISIELEGMTGQAMPAAQLSTLLSLLVWIGQQHPSLVPYVPGQTLIRHADIDPRDKAFCPGSGVDLAQIAQQANAGLAPAAEPWRRAWALRGVPLPEDQVNWAIPQLYKYNFAQLGACVVPEQYLVPGRMSVAIFERGFIYYLARTNRAYIGAILPSGDQL